MSTLVFTLVLAAAPLRVCADPNNLPFSNDRLEGFENRVAAVLGRALDRPVQYTWWAQRRGFVRNTLAAGRCDVVMGVPAAFAPVRTTRPYYRSTYVFAWRRDRHLSVASLDDPALARLRIGIPLVGDDGANPPPAHALGRRGIVDNVVGFPVYGDYREDNPSLGVMQALADGRIDLAIVWGPLAGFLARKRHVPLRIVPTPAADGGLPFTFDISLGVRKDDVTLAARLDQALVQRRAEIARILEDYGVPRVR